MTALQTVNLGTAPAGSDGDPVRTGFTKVNSNVVVLNAQAALTSAAATITTAQALTAALHVGKRVNISLATAGTINLPEASTCAADQVTLLRNIGSTVATLATTPGSGDTIALSKLNPGEAALMDTDGVHAWNVLMRGRTNSDNETVNGNCAVSGNESVGGTLAVTGNTTVGGTLGVTGQVTVANDGNLTYAAGNQRGLNWMAGTSIRWRIYTDGVAEAGSNAGSNLAFARYTDAGVYVDNPLAINRASGVFAFTYRPTFAGKTPWDSGNLDPAAFIKPGECGTLRRTPLPIAGYAFADGWPGWWAWDKSTGNSPNGGWGVYTQFGNKPDGKFGDQSFQFSLAFDTDGGVWHTRNVNGTGLGWKRFWTEANTIVDANNFIKRA
ncbi:hypothetical protein [Burkholderia ubonensis]|uniref:hypothetical protein n=1 Tax=Burkholderia ubonensis TaxID=101571 RepID=UPI000A5968EB|nr:hypothetical protein [Burkholderia ubonensis]